MLPPGRARLPMNPCSTGLKPNPMTIGIVGVASFAAGMAALTATMTSTRSCTSSRASTGTRSIRPSAKPPFDDEILAVGVAQLTQGNGDEVWRCLKRRIWERARRQDAQLVHLPGWLGVANERRGEDARKGRDERAPTDHWITW